MRHAFALLLLAAFQYRVGCDCGESGSKPTADAGATDGATDGGTEDADSGLDGGLDACVETLWFEDSDQDGFGARRAQWACDAPAGYASRSEDCDDSEPRKSPGATEVCDGLDNDCDCLVDEGFSVGALCSPGSCVACAEDGGTACAPGDAGWWYADEDADSFGNPDAGRLSCAAPSGHSVTPGDCDDRDPFSHPGAVEFCDLRDNDCDGLNDNSGACNADGGLDAGLDAVALPPTRLVFLVNPAATSRAGFAFPIQPRVAVQDALGRIVADAGQSVTLAPSSDPGCTVAALGALRALTNPLAPDAGVAVFDAVAHSTAEAVYLRATAPGLSPACSSRVQVSGDLFVEAGAALGVCDTGTADYGWAAFSDLDRDGRPDLAFNSGDGPRLFFNRSFGWTDLARPFGRHQRAIVFGDCDGDGLRDVVTTTSGAVSLYRNRGDGGFIDFTGASNLATNNPEGAGFLDFDRDGRLDLVVPSGGDTMGLWRNLGNCTFVDATEAAKLPLSLSNGELVLVGDYDVDGDVDVFYTTAQNYGGGQGRLWLFRNAGDGTFATPDAGLETAGLDFRSGLALGDYDNDGDFDVFVGRASPGKPALYRNGGDGTFTDVSASTGDLAGTSAITAQMAGASFGDLDNDGFLDLLVVVNGNVDRLYRNLGDGTFRLESATTGLLDASDDKSSTGVALADVDLDGDLDAYINNRGFSPARLYLNQSSSRSFLKVRVVGRGPGFSPVDGTGVVVFLYDQTGTQLLATREVSGGGAMGQNEPLVHFGLANSWGAEKGRYVVRVRFSSALYTWPAVVVPEAATVDLGGRLVRNAVEITEP